MESDSDSDSDSEEGNNFYDLMKKGNMSSATAAVGNTALAIVKGFAAFFTGNGAMFASTMHSIADAVNQAFVFTGSVLAEKKPTRRFPTGFGRVINIFCMLAVVFVSMMAYKTIKEGIHLIQHPAETSGIWINLMVLLLTIAVDGFVFVKAMKEIVKETRVEAKGFNVVLTAFKNVKRAAPPTRLVFYEDLVATFGAILAFISILIISMTNLTVLDGVTTVIIGILMVIVAFRVGYDNMVGLIGVSAPPNVEKRVAHLILTNNAVVDIRQMRVIQEGRYYHVDGMLELKMGLSLADADDIKFSIKEKLLSDPDISDVTLGIIEDDGIKTWTSVEGN